MSPIIILLVLLVAASSAGAVYVPPGPVANVSAHTPTNFCPRAISFIQGHLNLSTALKGMSLQVAGTLWLCRWF